MPDWTRSMQQTFEYHVVDPNTWKDKSQLHIITGSSIERDSETDTLGSASINMTELVDECYIRIYLITVQDGVREKHTLGTYLVQTPSSSFDGRVRNISADAYTPLLELKENPPPVGFYIRKKENIMEAAYKLVSDHARAPAAETTSSNVLSYDFVANNDDTWFSFISDLISNAKHVFDLDENGRILFAPIQETASLQPVYTFNDDNSSVLYPDVELDHDLYGIPNVVEIIHSTSDRYYTCRVVNDDPDSPISTVNRGREIIHREINPEVNGALIEDVVTCYKVEYDKETKTYKATYEEVIPEDEKALDVKTTSGEKVYSYSRTIEYTDRTEKETGYLIKIKESKELKQYAIDLLKELSTVNYTVTFTYAYRPIRLGDCVRLNYTAADIINVKAKIISQSIKCTPGCPVTAKAVYTEKLWR